MTIAEKIEMYKNKKAFITAISKAFETEPSASTVYSVNYEVYSKKINEDITYFEEYVIVYFCGGGFATKRVSGNSSTANFRAIGALIDGGYYDEVRDYETLVERGFELVSLEG